MSSNIFKGYNLYNFEASFREFLISEAVSPITLKNYLSDLRHFLGWYFFHLSSKSSVINLELNNSPYSYLSYLNSIMVLDYRKYLESNNIPVKSINRRLSTLRKFCTFCISQGWLKTNPAKEISNNQAVRKLDFTHPYLSDVVEERNDGPKTQPSILKVAISEYKNTLVQPDASSTAKDLDEFFSITNLQNIFNE